MLRRIPKLTALPALDDNYIWLPHDDQGAIAVDPGEAEPILSWLKQHGLSLEAILVTHHHGDHVAGIRELVARHPCPVYGPASATIPALSHPVNEGMILELGLLSQVRVMEIPGHTLDHLAYLAGDWLFCGDTLFSCGCGRLFEGTAAQMYDSLARIADLPDATLICCAHEYTLANVDFARRIDDSNVHLLNWARKAAALRAAGHPTLPVRLGEERLRNPFLRCCDASIQARLAELMGRNGGDGLATFTWMREMKNHG